MPILKFLVEVSPKLQARNAFSIGITIKELLHSSFRLDSDSIKGEDNE